MEIPSLFSLSKICTFLYISIAFVMGHVQATISTTEGSKESIVKKTGDGGAIEVRDLLGSYGHENEYYGNTGYGDEDVGYGQSKGYGGGGGGHGGGHGGGGYGHGAITLDPVSIISLLALGAFLINNILQLLRTNMQTGRSLNVRDIDIPLDLSDWSSGDAIEDHSRISEDDPYGPSFNKFFANVGSLYYLHPKKRNMCIKKVVCNYINGQQSREDTRGTIRTRMFEFMLSTITRLVAPEIKNRSKMGFCQKFNKYCSDAVLHDAKISTENKVYSTVTSIVSNFAFQRLFSG